MLEISKLTKKDEDDWENYVNKSDNSTFYHRIEWKNTIESIYGYEPVYLMVKENNGIRGVLPLFIIKNVLNKKIISVPFGSYGGVCAENEEIQDLLIESAKSITREKGLDFLELRNFSKVDSLATNDSYVTFITDLNPGIESIWKNVKRDKQRKVKKARERDLRVEWGNDLKNFYYVHSYTMKNIGSPTHSYAFFRKIYDEFGDNVRVLLIYHNGQPISSWMLISHGNTLTSVWGSSLDDFKEYYAYDLANWEAIEYAYKNGYRYFDIGRCLRNSGIYNYKKRWGASLRPLYYQHYSNNNKVMLDYSQHNPKRQKFSRIWKKLPMHVTNSIGPVLRGKFP